MMSNPNCPLDRRMVLKSSLALTASGFDGSLVARARITVDLNGKRIHNDVELPYSERAFKNRREKPDLKKPGRIILQHHGDPIDFRNIWIVECSSEEGQWE